VTLFALFLVVALASIRVHRASLVAEAREWRQIRRGLR